ncbi:MAG: L-threonylcarbamoyladenylate synthase [Spirochaetes bacterium]|nr:L-threonylcarbamoyladenylate synthase [Spirochaetota bacterium]
MEILSNQDNDIKKAAKAIIAGALVAFPTETVYGLGADAFNPIAIARVFEAKNRPSFNPLIIHIAEFDTLPRIADISGLSEAGKEMFGLLSKQLWPGPLTLILPKQAQLPGIAAAGLDTVAVRFPSHPVAQKLIRFSTGALAAPSANPSGCLSPTRANHVSAQMGNKVDFIIDGGKTLVGLESTVLDISRETPCILRPGGISRETIEALIGTVLLENSSMAVGNEDKPSPISPGQLKSHYAPRTLLILHKPGELAGLPQAANEGRLYFSTATRHSALSLQAPAPQNQVRILSQDGCSIEAAANLFEMLHELDSLGLELIRAEEAPALGLGEAINDRLRRAAT